MKPKPIDTSTLGPIRLELRPAKLARGWYPIASAPKDRLILIGWYGEVSGTFKLARVQWSEPPHCHAAGWWEFNSNGLGSNRYFPELPKFWAEDTLGVPTPCK